MKTLGQIGYETMLMESGEVVGEHPWEAQPEQLRADWEAVAKAIIATAGPQTWCPTCNRYQYQSGSMERAGCLWCERHPANLQGGVTSSPQALSTT